MEFGCARAAGNRINRHKRQVERTVFSYPDAEIPPILVETVAAVAAEANGKPAKLPGIARRLEIGRNAARQRLYRVHALGLVQKVHRTGWAASDSALVAATVTAKNRKARKVKPR